jgi:rod shape-determining protein MreC
MAMIGWRMARSRGSLAAQMPLAICSVLAVVIALLGRAESSFFDVVRARLTDLAEPMLAGLYAPVTAFERTAVGLSSILSVYRENAQLRQENAELKKWQNVALSLEQRLNRYELLLKAIPDPNLPSTTARVIGQSSRPFAKTMIVNVGLRDAIKKGQAVLDDRGLIGRIYLTGERTSWVILLSDLNSRVPVVIEPSNRRAILAGDNTVSPQLELDLGSAPVKAGDRVVSTGDGGLLPPDLAVGTVIGERGTLRVALFADADASDYVHVLSYDGAVNPPSAENDPPLGVRPAAAKETQALAKAANLPLAPAAKPASPPAPQASLPDRAGAEVPIPSDAAAYEEEDR